MAWYDPRTWFLARSLAADLTRTLPPAILEAQEAGVLDKPPASDQSFHGLAMELPPLPVGNFSNPAQVQSALAQHSIGNLQMSGQLAIALLRDPRIFGPLNIRCTGTCNLPMEFIPANDSPLAKDIADFCREGFTRWFPISEQVRFERTQLLLGVSLAQMIWKPLRPGQREQEPEISCWGASSSRMFWYWDGTRNYGKWLVAYKEGVGEPVPGDGQWVWCTLTAKEPWNEGLINPLGYYYAGRMNALLRQNQFIDRMAKPYLVMTTPMDMDQESLEELQQQLETGDKAIIFIPSGEHGNESKAEWVGVKSTSWEVFGQSMSQYALDCSIAILGQNLTSEVQGGSHAAASVHNDVRQDLIDLDCARRALNYREQILKPIVVRNFAQDRPELAPYIRYKTAPSPTGAERAQALASLGTFFDHAPSNVDTDDLLRQFEVKTR